MDDRQTKINADYQETLNTVYSGTITARGKYLNPRAVIQHHCKNCMTNFYARPLWLVNKRQVHECFSAPMEKGKAIKKTTPKKATGTKKGNSQPNKVTEEMKLEMIRLYKEGNSMKSISRQFSVTPPTVKRHILKSGIK